MSQYRITPLRFIIHLVTVLVLMTMLGVWAFLHISKTHHGQIEKMYQFAEVEYNTDDFEDFIIQYEHPAGRILQALFAPKTPSMTETFFELESLEKLGFSPQCADFEYLDLFDNNKDKSYYNDLNTCCTGNVQMPLPIAYDKRYDRVLIMCGFASDAHVAALPVDKFNWFFTNPGDVEPVLDARTIHDAVE